MSWCYIKFTLLCLYLDVQWFHLPRYVSAWTLNQSERFLLPSKLSISSAAVILSATWETLSASLLGRLDVGRITSSNMIRCFAFIKFWQRQVQALIPRSIIQILFIMISEIHLLIPQLIIQSFSCLLWSREFIVMCSFLNWSFVHSSMLMISYARIIPYVYKFKSLSSCGLTWSSIFPCQVFMCFTWTCHIYLGRSQCFL